MTHTTREFEIIMAELHNKQEDDYAWLHGTYQPNYVKVPDKEE